MTAKERLSKVFNGEKPDRVPISLYEFDGFYDNWIFNYPEYREILEYAQGKTDKMYFWSPSIEGDHIFYGRIDKDIIKIEEWEESESVYKKTVINTPYGEVYSVSRRDKGVHTTWTIEPFCKDSKDAEKVLSIPYVPLDINIDSFFDRREQLGEEGILMGDVSDPLCCTVELFGFSTFLMMYMEQPKIIFKLMDFFQERIYNYLKQILEKGAVTLYRIVGAEYATPPYLSPKEFANLVIPFEREIVNLLHKFGAKARLHSHGKIKEVLKGFLEIDIDATDPIEPPPDGDVTLKEARKILGEKIVLIGNIEERLFEIGTKEEIEDAVKKAVEETEGRNFILCPTAMPLTTPLPDKVKENILHYIDSGIKYGKL